MDRHSRKQVFEGARVLILSGEFKGVEGVCLGKENSSNRWAVSPDRSEEILALAFESDFALLIDLSANSTLN
jgi:hypothetical protein